MALAPGKHWVNRHNNLHLVDRPHTIVHRADQMPKRKGQGLPPQEALLGAEDWRHPLDGVQREALGMSARGFKERPRKIAQLIKGQMVALGNRFARVGCVPEGKIRRGKAFRLLVQRDMDAGRVGASDANFDVF
jgi:hypothetical protein